MSVAKLKPNTVKKISKLVKLKKSLVAKLDGAGTALKPAKAKADLEGFCQFLGLLCSNVEAERKSAIEESEKYFSPKIKKNDLDEVKQKFLAVREFAKAVKEEAEEDSSGSELSDTTTESPSGPSTNLLSAVNKQWAKAFKEQQGSIPPVIKAIMEFANDSDATVQKNAKSALQKVKNSTGKYLEYGKALTKAIEAVIKSVGSDQVMDKMDDLQVAVATVENHIDNDAEVKSLMVQFEGGDFFKPTVDALSVLKKFLSKYLRG